MTTAVATAAPGLPGPPRLPTHKDLPETDGTVPTNFHQHIQSGLFSGCIRPLLGRLFPDGRFIVGNDSFIYWRMTDPPTRGAKAPDWFLVLGVEPMLEGEWRRSYVLWQEVISPLIVVEYFSGDGAEERDRTPFEGKFWVYEKGIKATYYAILDGMRGTLDLHARHGDGYRPVQANAAGRYPIPELGVELGLWHATLEGTTGWYMRPWDAATGEMLPSHDEDRARVGEAERVADDMRRDLAAEAEQTLRARRDADDARRQTDEARGLADRLAARLRELGVDPAA